MEARTFKTSFSRLALTGLVGSAAGLLMVGCDDKGTATSDVVPTDLVPTVQAVESMGFSDLHDCAGLNTCKGLGGCHVDASKLQTLAEKVGVSADKAGQAHDCAGKNACKGLGGCHVDATRLQKLKAQLAG